MINLNLSNIDLGNLTVQKLEPITDSGPILFRRYTLTHSDDRSNLYLTISPEYLLSIVDPVSGYEVLGQWVWAIDDTYILTLFVFIGDNSYPVSKIRYENFLDNLPRSVSSIVNGDKKFLESNQNLSNSYISMRFISPHDEFNKTIYYCRVNNFLV